MITKHRLVFFGTINELSRTAFEALVTGNIDILAVFVSAASVAESPANPIERLVPTANPGDLPLINPYHERTLLHAAWSAGAPIYALADAGSRELIRLLDELQPDAACVACFPAKLPVNLISRTQLGFLNVHPALLPRYRGPAPLFWLFQKGDLSHRGVSVHLMDAGLDTGPLVAQKKLAFADGLDQAAIERICGNLGGQLLLQGLDSLATGQNAWPQPGGGTYHPWPSSADYTLNLSWSARRAFNFMCATDSSGIAYQVPLPGQNLALAEALQFTEKGRLSAPAVIRGMTAQIQFRPGTLSARLSPLA